MNRMWHKNTIVLVTILISIFLFSGCGISEEKIDEAIHPAQEDIQVVDDSNVVVKEDENSAIKKAANKEGISVNEMERILDDLVRIGAEKYSITKDAYTSQIESNGKTVLEEWQIAADHLGMSIKELYEYEKANAKNLTDEQKENMSNLANAVKLAEEVEIPETGATDVENMLGIYDNDSGEIRVVGGVFEEQFYFKADIIELEYEDEYSLTVEYVSNESFDVLSDYYIGLLKNTEEYMLLAPNGVPQVMIQGMFNEAPVFVEIIEDESGLKVSCYLDLS